MTHLPNIVPLRYTLGMVLHWKDDIHGEERSARQQREDAVRKLIKARRRLAAVTAVLVLAPAFLILWLAIGAHLSAVIVAAGALPAVFSLRRRRAQVTTRRDALAAAQERYDEVSARLAAHEEKP